MHTNTPLERALESIARSSTVRWSPVDEFSRRTCMEAFPPLTPTLKDPAARAYMCEGVGVTQLGQYIRVCWGRGAQDIATTNNIADAVSLIESKIGVRHTITREQHQQLLEATSEVPARVVLQETQTELTRLAESVKSVLATDAPRAFGSLID